MTMINNEMGSFKNKKWHKECLSIHQIAVLSSAQYNIKSDMRPVTGQASAMHYDLLWHQHCPGNEPIEYCRISKTHHLRKHLLSKGNSVSNLNFHILHLLPKLETDDIEKTRFFYVSIDTALLNLPSGADMAVSGSVRLRASLVS